eukprot:m.231079 g.231079  ORF g.231079 m.231079 type:complete len:1329 (-) comp13895_c4_seq1:92-4078(-)
MTTIAVLSLVVAVVLALTVPHNVNGDMYLQNMRGSNNRLDEARRDRDNANRLFDSQNNNRGGYNVGSLYYYEGERIPLEWTNQHGCGNDHNDCQIVIQYMCHDNLRDGVTTRTIPDQPSNCLNNDCNTDVRYGMHEDYDYYTNCKHRYRNQGLFTADRNLNGQTAIYTRQNNNGQRRGYECPEERDHYPYWHPTPWIDWVIFTNNASRCDLYRNNSENVVGRHYCSLPDAWYHHMVGRGGNGRNGFIPNTKETCEALNEENSPLVAFLRDQQSQRHEDLATVAVAEHENCLDTIKSCRDNSWNNITAQLCIDDFIANYTVTMDELESRFPDCPAGRSIHPESRSACPTCVPDSCLADRVDIKDNTTVCPDDFGLDPLSPVFCVPLDCIPMFNDSVSFQLNADQQRQEYLASTGLSLVNNEGICVQREIVERNCLLNDLARARWRLSLSHSERDTSVGAVRCLEADWSRPNHLGNGVGGFTNGWNLTHPSFAAERCAVRIRYNITTWDYNGADPHNSGEINSTLNKDSRNGPAHVNIAEAHGIPTTDSARPWENARGYLFEQNPQVQIFDFYVRTFYCTAGKEFVIPSDDTYCYSAHTNGSVNFDLNQKVKASSLVCRKDFPMVEFDTTTGAYMCTDGSTFLEFEEKDFELQLAINTAQFGRTFQDRSHRYKAVLRDEALRRQCGDIYALNVRGKRGNIVQTYPGTEYDFTPNRLHVREGDCVHFQWTGSNTNPNHNDGQGKQGTDRSNVAILEYVRGEGGRGVEKAGGMGIRNTFWTTKDQEPGLEGYMADIYPTMGDYPCPPQSNPSHTRVHPLNFTKCYMPTTCEWSDRPTETTDDGETVFVDCPSGMVVDVFAESMCVSEGCETSDRQTNSQFVADEEWYSQIGVPDALKHGAWGMSHPDHLDNVTRDGFIGLTYSEMVHLATLNNLQLGGEMSELDDAGTYFNLPPHSVTGVGTYHYLCTRNNNFSNRSQKGKIVVSEAPENSEQIGSQGGTVTMSTSDTYNGVPSDGNRVELSDFSIDIPPKSVSNLVHVGLKAIASSTQQIGLSGAASDVLEVTPYNLASTRTFGDVILEPVDTRRERMVVTEDVWISFRTISVGEVWYRIRSPAFEEYVTNYINDNRGVRPVVSVEFKTVDRQWAVVNTTFNPQFEVEGRWVGIAPSAFSAIEDGSMWVSIWFPGAVEYTGLPPVDSESGKPMTIRMPVSVSVSYGDVYYFENSVAGRACVYNGTNCHQLRQRVPGARIENGEAVFQVSGSQSMPAGGFYQVSSGNNVGLVAGVAVLLIILALATIGAAVYFRQHPEKWSNFKNYGPRKYKTLMMSVSDTI